MEIISDEINFIRNLSNILPKYDRQLNKFNTSDAELFKLPHSDNIIAITTDTISEEINLGFYNDPYSIGWMSVIVNISDLCAVGATPLLLLVNQTFAPNYSSKYIETIQLGVRDACIFYNISVLGGDTNFSELPSFGATAIGVFNETEKFIQRVGCKSNESIFCSGFLGRGNLNAFIKLEKLSVDFNFKPQPDIKLAKVIAKYGSSCIDTSDGLLSAIDIICKLNNIGVQLNQLIIQSLYPLCNEISKQTGISPWLFLAGQLGDYELLFTIPEKNEMDFLKECEKNSIEPIKIGKTIQKNLVIAESLKRNIDTNYIRNLHNTTKGDIKSYINNLINYFN